MVASACHRVMTLAHLMATVCVHQCTVGDTVKQVCGLGIETSPSVPVVCHNLVPDVSMCRSNTLFTALWKLNLLQWRESCVQ